MYYQFKSFVISVKMQNVIVFFLLFNYKTKLTNNVRKSLKNISVFWMFFLEIIKHVLSTLKLYSLFYINISRCKLINILLWGSFLLYSTPLYLKKKLHCNTPFSLRNIHSHSNKGFFNTELSIPVWNTDFSASDNFFHTLLNSRGVFHRAWFLLTGIYLAGFLHSPRFFLSSRGFFHSLLFESLIFIQNSKIFKEMVRRFVTFSEKTIKYSC